jgi:exodeoxyribonuclease VII large subunit
VATSRYALVEFDINDVLVQGETAATSMANAIKIADTKGYDVIVIGRGGGSIEDLWAFNEEVVADAVYQAKTPIISAVGHEIDTVISDLVADVRAATPSNAMEILLPDKNELLIYIDNLHTQLTQTIYQKIQKEEQLLSHLYKSFEQHSIEKKIELQLQSIENLKETFNQRINFQIEKKQNDLKNIYEELPLAINAVLSQKEQSIKNLLDSFKTNNPQKRSKKGFAQIVKDNNIVALEDLKENDEFEAQTSDIILKAKVLEKRNIK